MKLQTPTTKLQRGSKHQAATPFAHLGLRRLGLGTWCFSGAWSFCLDSDHRQSRRHERMNGSKPCGPSRDQRTSGQVPTRFAQRASPFPSPRPSPSGRGRILRCLSAQPCAGCSRRTSRANEAAAYCSLSPWERVRVRGIGLRFDSAPRAVPKLVELCESRGAGGFPTRS
jgi:hypothetical protein